LSEVANTGYMVKYRCGGIDDSSIFARTEIINIKILRKRFNTFKNFRILVLSKDFIYPRDYSVN